MRADRIEWAGGLFSAMPQTTWWGGLVGRHKQTEVRTALRVGAGQRVLLTASRPGRLAIHRCFRDMDTDQPTWMWQDRRTGRPWNQPGACGRVDSELIAVASVSPGWQMTVGVFARPTLLILRCLGPSEQLLTLEACRG
jgi:hypothetical protein